MNSYEANVPWIPTSPTASTVQSLSGLLIKTNNLVETPPTVLFESNYIHEHRRISN